MNRIPPKHIEYCKTSCYMGKSFYIKCWRLQFKEPCLKLKQYILEKQNEFYINKKTKMFQLNNKNNKGKMLDLCGEDTFDYKGEDISNMEFIENEIFFDMRD